MKIVIPGGTGQVGQILARHFHENGHDVTVLSRTPHPAPWRVITWDGLTPGRWVAQLEHSDVCINLAGRSVDCRYNPANRRAIFDSRVLSTQLLNQVITSLNHPPAVWLNASTATIYRHSLDRPMDEATGELGGNEPGAPDTWNFSIDVAKAWEAAFFSTPTPRTRKVALRSAMTFSSRPRRSLRRLPQTRPLRSRRHQRPRHAIRLMDPRSRLHPLHRTPHRHTGLYWSRQPRLTLSPPQSRLPSRPSRGLGHPHRFAHHIMDDRDRHLPHAHRIGIDSKEPPGRPGPPPRRRFSVHFPALACRRQGPRHSLEITKIYCLITGLRSIVSNHGRRRRERPAQSPRK